MMRPIAVRHIPVLQDMAYLFPPPGRAVQAQRDIMLPYVYERDGKCFLAGCPGFDPCTGHEGVVTRGDVQGWPKSERCLIHVFYNTVFLCSKHHNTELEPSRLYIAKWMIARYGNDWIRWLETLPFKQRPPTVRQILREF